MSTGALMAPFAFLGPQYDEALQGFYTTTTTADVFTERSRMMTGEFRAKIAEGIAAGIVAYKKANR